MNALRHWLPVLVGAYLSTFAASARAIEFEFIFDDDPGSGFFDPVQGEQFREAAVYAGEIWGKTLRSRVPGETITVRAKFGDYPAGSTTLASAAPHHHYSDFGSSVPQYREETNYPKSLANHLAGVDLSPTRHEIDITFNRARPWYLGLDGTPASGQRDFVTVALHELGHGLGFDSSIRADGNYGHLGDRSYTNPCPGCLPTPFDHFLEALNGQDLLLMSDDDDRAAALVSNNLFWNGAGGALGNGGARPAMEASNPYDEGSSTSHLSEATHGVELMSPNYSAADHIIGAIELGMLRDMGWNVSVTPQTVVWTGASGVNSAATEGNWTPALPMSGDNLQFAAAGPGGADIAMDLDFGMLGQIEFAAGATEYALRFRPEIDSDLVGAGVVNGSSQTPTIILEAYPAQMTSGPGVLAPSKAARLVFKNAATAGDVEYELQGGATGIHSMPPLAPIFNRSKGAELVFFNSATAGNADIDLEGGIGNGAPGARVVFKHASGAGDADIVVQGGRKGLSIPLYETRAGFGGDVRFEDAANAGTASIRNDGVIDGYYGSGGYTTFADDSRAANADIDNHGSSFQWTGYPSSGGVTEFVDRATAEDASIRNFPGESTNGGGRTSFFHHSTAGAASILNISGRYGVPGPGETHFRNNARAGTARIANGGSTTGHAHAITRFFDESTAESATIWLNAETGGGGKLEFSDESTAGSATINFESAPPTSGWGGRATFLHNSSAGGSIINIADRVNETALWFDDHSTADSAQVSAEDGSNARIYFYDHSTAGDANFVLGRQTTLGVYDDATAANATIDVRAGAFVDVRGYSTTGKDATASLGSARVTVHGAAAAGGVNGGSVSLGDYSTSDDAVVTVRGGLVPNARGGSFSVDLTEIGAATIILEGGQPGALGASGSFHRGGSGPAARILAQAGSTLSFVGDSAFFGDSEIGSISGGGRIEVGGVTHLITGLLNRNDVITGNLSLASSWGPGGRVTKRGTGMLTFAGSSTLTGVTTVDEGAMQLTGSIAGDVVVNSGALLLGTGSIGGSLTVGGAFSPGASPGTMTLNDLALAPGGVLEFEVGADRDHLIVTGDVHLAGTLNLSMLSGFTPALGQSFTLFEGALGAVSGQFDMVNLPIVAGRSFDLSYSGNSVAVNVVAGPLHADFNEDGIVDAADLIVWRGGFGVSGSATRSQGDADGDQKVDGADLLIWQHQFGVTLASLASGPVPEPHGFALMAVGIAVVIGAASRTEMRQNRY